MKRCLPEVTIKTGSLGRSPLALGTFSIYWIQFNHIRDCHARNSNLRRVSGTYGGDHIHTLNNGTKNDMFPVEPRSLELSQRKRFK